MSTPVWVEFVCGGCATSVGGRYTKQTVPRREMLKAAKEQGWRFDKNGDCYCRSCAVNYPPKDLEKKS